MCVHSLGRHIVSNAVSETFLGGVAIERLCVGPGFGRHAEDIDQAARGRRLRSCGRVPLEPLHASVGTENQNAPPKVLRAKKERDHVFPDKLAHVQNVGPLLAFVSHGLTVWLTITGARLCFGHSDKWWLVVLVDSLR